MRAPFAQAFPQEDMGINGGLLCNSPRSSILHIVSRIPTSKTGSSLANFEVCTNALKEQKNLSACSASSIRFNQSPVHRRRSSASMFFQRRRRASTLKVDLEEDLIPASDGEKRPGRYHHFGVLARLVRIFVESTRPLEIG